MTPAQRRHVQLVGRRRRAWWPWILLLAVLTLVAWIHALREIDALERALRQQEPSSVTIVAPSRAMAADLDACHRRLDAIDVTITAIEHRRGNEPPRTLAEQRAYRAAPAGPPFVPGRGELSE